MVKFRTKNEQMNKWCAEENILEFFQESKPQKIARPACQIITDCEFPIFF
jgi:hypothetical protein